MKNIQPLNEFFNSEKLNEVKLPTMRLDEIIDDITQVNNNTLKRVLVSYYKTYDDYIDLTDKKKHFFKVHDMVGDIMNNNRVSFDVCIYEKQDLDRYLLCHYQKPCSEVPPIAGGKMVQTSV